MTEMTKMTNFPKLCETGTGHFLSAKFPRIRKRSKNFRAAVFSLLNGRELPKIGIQTAFFWCEEV
jgi:hypothetical protein